MLIYLLIIVLLVMFLWSAREHAWLDFSVLGDRKLLILTISQCLVLALYLGWRVWRWASWLPQAYTDLVPGWMGFYGGNKSAEYYGLFSAIVAYIILFVLVSALYSRTLYVVDRDRTIPKLALFTMLPSAILAGQSLRIADTSVLLSLSAAFILLFFLAVGSALFLSHQNIIEPQSVGSAASQLVTFALFLASSELAGAVFFPRVGVPGYHKGMLGAAVIVVGAVLIALQRGGSSRYSDPWAVLLVLSQLAVPFIVFVLASPPVRLQQGHLTFFPYRPALSILLWGLVLVSALDIGRRARALRRGDASLHSLISPWVLAALLVFVQSTPVTWPAIGADDYHSGEFYLPWWLFKQFGALPFAGYEPVRGLINYLPGLLSWLFYDNTFSGQAMVLNHFSALYVFLTFFALRPVVGNLAAFLGTFSLFDYAGIPGGGVVIASACVALLYGRPRDRDYLFTFWLWIGLAIVASAMYVAEGVVFVIATIPFGVWLAVRAYRTTRTGLLWTMACAVLAAFILFTATPLGSMAKAASAYLVGQAGVNDVANAQAWQYPTTIGDMVTSGYLWQLIRFSWLFLLIPITYRLLQQRSTSFWGPESLLLVAFLIMVTLMVPRAAGAIGIEVYSRPGWASLAFLACALPLIVLPATKNELHKAVALVLIAVSLGLIGNQEAGISAAFGQVGLTVRQPRNLVSGDQYQLHNIGTDVTMDGAQLRRQIGIRHVLSSLLKPNETYYDATNHNSDYGFQGLPSPVTVPAAFNTSTERQQFDALRSLEEKKIALALTEDENILWVGGPLSLRDFWIYRYLIQNYEPFTDQDGHVWMIRKDQTGRLAQTGYQIGSSGESLDLLDRAFLLPDLKELPASWGKSINGLRGRLGNPVDLLASGRIVSAHNMSQSADGQWRSSGPDPSFVISLPADVRGDVLFLETDRPIGSGYFQIFWMNEYVPTFRASNSFVFNSNSKEFLIPVSSAPSWELSTAVQQIRIDLPNQFRGMLRFERITIYDRVPGN